jgi:hypothetical protein
VKGTTAPDEDTITTQESTMTEKEAQRQLRLMLRSFSPGRILHLLAEAFRAHAQQYRNDDAARIKQQCDLADACLFVVGLGLDAACPR